MKVLKIVTAFIITLDDALKASEEIKKKKKYYVEVV